MQFSDFLIFDLIESHNERAFVNAMNMVDHPDLDPNKKDRFRYGCYIIQPPSNLKKMSKKKRLGMYYEIKHFLVLLYDAIQLVQRKGLGEVFKPANIEDDGKTLAVWRLMYDEDNEYAELYQQEDDNKNGKWERGDYIFNLGAKNDNLHTIVHAIGHQHYYECLSDEQAEEWKDFYDIRKYKEKKEFVSEYASENHREDYAETFAVYVLGRDRINEMYDKMKITKNIAALQKIMSKFRRTIFVKKKNKSAKIR